MEDSDNYQSFLLAYVSICISYFAIYVLRTC